MASEQENINLFIAFAESNPDYYSSSMIRFAHDKTVWLAACQSMQAQIDLLQKVINDETLDDPFRYSSYCQQMDYEFSKQIKQLEAELEKFKVNLSTCKNDYWFMTNLIDKYSSDKDQALKDCRERMMFRMPLFNILGKQQDKRSKGNEQ